MIVIADKKKRVTLPTKPGVQFDVSALDGGQLVLTPVAASRPRALKADVRKVGRYSVGCLNRQIRRRALQEALADLP